MSSHQDSSVDSTIHFLKSLAHGVKSAVAEVHETLETARALAKDGLQRMADANEAYVKAKSRADAIDDILRPFQNAQTRPSLTLADRVETIQDIALQAAETSSIPPDTQAVGNVTLSSAHDPSLAALRSGRSSVSSATSRSRLPDGRAAAPDPSEEASNEALPPPPPPPQQPSTASPLSATATTWTSRPEGSAPLPNGRGSSTKPAAAAADPSDARGPATGQHRGHDLGAGAAGVDRVRPSNRTAASDDDDEYAAASPSSSSASPEPSDADDSDARGAVQPARKRFRPSSTGPTAASAGEDTVTVDAMRFAKEAIAAAKLAQVSVPTSTVKFSKRQISKWIGGGPMTLLSRVSTTNEATRIYHCDWLIKILKPQYHFLPPRPGWPCALTELEGQSEWDLSRAYPLFSKVAEDEFRYLGEYKVVGFKEVPVATWKSLPRSIREMWVRNAKKSSRWGQNLLQARGIVRNSKERDLMTEAQLERYFVRTEMPFVRLRIALLTCLGFNHVLYDAMVAAHRSETPVREVQPAAPKARGGPRATNTSADADWSSLDFRPSGRASHGPGGRKPHRSTSSMRDDGASSSDHDDDDDDDGREAETEAGAGAAAAVPAASEAREKVATGENSDLVRALLKKVEEMEKKYQAGVEPRRPEHEGPSGDRPRPAEAPKATSAGGDGHERAATTATAMPAAPTAAARPMAPPAPMVAPASTASASTPSGPRREATGGRTIDTRVPSSGDGRNANQAERATTGQSPAGYGKKTMSQSPTGHGWKAMPGERTTMGQSPAGHGPQSARSALSDPTVPAASTTTTTTVPPWRRADPPSAPPSLPPLAPASRPTEPGSTTGANARGPSPTTTVYIKRSPSSRSPSPRPGSRIDRGVPYPPKRKFSQTEAGSLGATPYGRAGFGAGRRGRYDRWGRPR